MNDSHFSNSERVTVRMETEVMRRVRLATYHRSQAESHNIPMGKVMGDALLTILPEVPPGVDVNNLGAAAADDEPSVPRKRGRPPKQKPAAAPAPRSKPAAKPPKRKAA